jgi:hypothetical protein
MVGKKPPVTKCGTLLIALSAAKVDLADASPQATPEQVLRELEGFARGQHPDQQTPLMRFTRCEDLSVTRLSFSMALFIVLSTYVAVILLAIAAGPLWAWIAPWRKRLDRRPG